MSALIAKCIEKYIYWGMGGHCNDITLLEVYKNDCLNIFEKQNNVSCRIFGIKLFYS